MSDDTAAADTPAGSDDAVLRIEGLQTWFHVDGEDHRAVDGVDITVPRGRVTAIVGESGCGKSVTAYSILRLINRPGRIVGGRILFRPDSGEALDLAALDERDPRLYQVRGGGIGMIFQEPMTALSPVHSIGNQLCEALLLHRTRDRREAERMAIEMLARVGLPGPAERIHHYPHQLSGGMRQRVVIAMALVCRPQLIIADEPTTALDVTIQAQILRLLKDLQQEMGAAVLLITHDLGVVAQTADEVSVMYLGRVVESGPVRRVLKRPRHPYTRGLLASLPGLHGQGERLPSIAGSVPPLSALPPGCPFHPRCPLYQPGLCDRGGRPPLEPVAGGGGAACLRLDQTAGDWTPQEGMA
ncbi:MAG: ABC transporter ATP-binding protein [Planctomycetota bacterium]